MIIYFEGSYENGIDIDTRNIDEIVKNFKYRYQQNDSNNDVLERRGAINKDDILYQGESTSNISSDNEAITSNNRGEFREELEEYKLLPNIQYQ